MPIVLRCDNINFMKCERKLSLQTGLLSPILLKREIASERVCKIDDIVIFSRLATAVWFYTNSDAIMSQLH